MAVNTPSQGVYYSGVASTPYPPRLPLPPVPHNATETQHASLKRKKDEPTPPISSLYSPVMEKTEVCILLFRLFFLFIFSFMRS